jgi:hypothetical protein
MVMLCADCNQLKHPGTECQTPEDNMVDHSRSNQIIQAAYDRGDIKPVCKNLYPFETTPHVCSKCKSHHWHANLFYENSASCWHQDDPAFWCGDCKQSVDLQPLIVPEKE